MLDLPPAELPRDRGGGLDEARSWCRVTRVTATRLHLVSILPLLRSEQTSQYPDISATIALATFCFWIIDFFSGKNTFFVEILDKS